MQIRLPERTAKMPLARVTVTRGGTSPSTELFDDTHAIYEVKGDFEQVEVTLANGRGVVDETFNPIIVKADVKPKAEPKFTPKAEPKVESEPEAEPEVKSAKTEPKTGKGSGSSHKGW